MTTEASEYRACPNCGKPVKLSATTCGYCWTKFPPRVNEAAPTSEMVVDAAGSTNLSSDQRVYSAPPVAHSSTWSNSISRRYRDIYSVAFAVIAQGERLKAFAISAGILMFVLLAWLTLASVRSYIEGAGLIFTLSFDALFAIFTAMGIYSYGVRVAAEGQQLLAAVDVAVNTSPFLTLDERANILQLH